MKIKRLMAVLAMLFIFFSAPLFAQNRIVDNAGLLSDDDIAGLKESADKIASAYSFDLVIVTEKDIGAKSPIEYADDFFDDNGYGLGKDRDGCLFLIVSGSRDYWFSTSGRGIEILNSAAYNKLEGGVVSALKNNDPDIACRTFIHNWEEFLILDAKGRNYNFFYEWNLVLVIAAWVVSLLIGFIIVQIWKAQMNTALPKKEADAYIIPGSLAFTQKQDRFLYSTVTKTAKPKQDSSGGGSGGTHISSSGRSHGGGGGKY